MPNHYYGYSPQEEEADISFGSVPEIRDTVYRKPLEDMPTNPSNPLYQAMDNQRGPTYQQEQQQQEEREPDISFANEIEQRNLDIGTQGTMSTFDSAPLAAAMNNQSPPAVNQDTMEPLTGTVDEASPGGRPLPRAGESAFDMSSGTIINPVEGDLGVNTGNDDQPDKTPTVTTDRDDYVPTPSDPVNPTNPLDGFGGANVGGGNIGTGSGNTGGNTGGNQFRGSMLEQALSDYNVEALQDFYGNVFDEYDPTRQSFVEQRGLFDTRRLNLQRDEAGIGLERQQGQLGRQADTLQDQLGLNVNLNRIREEQTQLQREALEMREEDVDVDFAMRQRMLGLQEEQQAQALDATRSGARNQLMGLYGQSQVTGGFAGSGARDMVRQRAIDSFTDNASNRISSLADTRRIGLARQQATQQRDRQLRGLGSQLSGLDLADRQRQFQFDSQQGRVSSALEGIQSELGDEGFLQRSFENRMSNLDVTERMQELGREESIFGLQEDYRKDVRGRLIDIIRGGGNLDRFKLTEQEKLDRGGNQTTQYGTGGMGAYDTGFGGNSMRT